VKFKESGLDAMKFIPNSKDVAVPLTELILDDKSKPCAGFRAAIEQRMGDSRSPSEPCPHLARIAMMAANHPFVKIQAPTDAMFSNQKFAPLTCGNMFPAVP